MFFIVKKITRNVFENCVIQFEKEKEKNINKYLNLCYKKQGFRVVSRTVK